MKEPEHIKEIHAIRAKIAAKYGYDLKKYAKHLKEVEKRSGRVINKLPVRG